MKNNKTPEELSDKKYQFPTLYKKAPKENQMSARAPHDVDSQMLCCNIADLA